MKNTNSTNPAMPASVRRVRRVIIDDWCKYTAEQWVCTKCGYSKEVEV